MPFLSKAQRAWMFKNKPEMAKKWAEHTPEDAQLPEHVKKAARVAKEIKPSRFTPNRRFTR